MNAQPLDAPLTGSHALTIYDHRALSGMEPPPRRTDQTFPRRGEKAAFIEGLRRTLQGSARLTCEEGAWHIRPALYSVST